MAEQLPNQGQASVNPALLQAIRQVLGRARQDIQQRINHGMVQAYWQVGRLIVEQEQQGEARAAYGKQQLEALSARLTLEFGKGFDASNLRNMRRFYLAFPIQDAVRHELSWTHYRRLIRIDNPTIGLILCSEKSEAVAKYSVLTDSEQLFASKYLTWLPSEQELQQQLQQERAALLAGNPDFYEEP